MKNSSGYAISAFLESRELIDLLVGSEGSLAVFTAIELALMPRPAARSTILVAFASLDTAVEAAVEARDSGAAACELLDRTFLAIAATAGNPLPVSPDAEAALLVEVEAADVSQAAHGASLLRARFAAMGATETIVSRGTRHESELWELRHAASPAIARMDASLKSMQFIEDAAVPPARLADYVRGVRAALDAAGTRGVIFGHAGDAHVHVNPLIDMARADWRRRVDQILMDVTALVAELGGTLTGEHGDGRLRTPLLDRVWSPEALRQFSDIKRCFDPRGLLNPGVKVSLAGQTPIGAVKYDPALAALPARARTALDVVERERGYSRLRFGLL